MVGADTAAVTTLPHDRCVFVFFFFWFCPVVSFSFFILFYPWCNEKVHSALYFCSSDVGCESNLRSVCVLPYDQDGNLGPLNYSTRVIFYYFFTVFLCKISTTFHCFPEP